LVELRVENSYGLSERRPPHPVIQLSSEKGAKFRRSATSIVDENAHSTQHAQVKSPRVKESFFLFFVLK
jgi:hypothetical protein